MTFHHFYIVTNRRLLVQAAWRKEPRMTPGWPKGVGSYDCRLTDGSEVMVSCHPGCDDELVDGGPLDQDIVAFRRIPGQTYTTAH